jgi:hypothetical protein
VRWAAAGLNEPTLLEARHVSTKAATAAGGNRTARHCNANPASLYFLYVLEGLHDQTRRQPTLDQLDHSVDVVDRTYDHRGPFFSEILRLLTRPAMIAAPDANSSDDEGSGTTAARTAVSTGRSTS